MKKTMGLGPRTRTLRDDGVEETRVREHESSEETWLATIQRKS